MPHSIKNRPEVFAVKVWFEPDKLWVQLHDGREVSVPLQWFPKLNGASLQDLNNFRLIGHGIGIHWENLDEDISIAGLL